MAASTLGDIFIIDPRSGEIVKKMKGHSGTINDIKELTIDGKTMFVTAGEDNRCLVFDPDREIATSSD